MRATLPGTTRWAHVAPAATPAPIASHCTGLITTVVDCAYAAAGAARLAASKPMNIVRRMVCSFSVAVLPIITAIDESISTNIRYSQLIDNEDYKDGPLSEAIRVGAR